MIMILVIVGLFFLAAILLSVLAAPSAFPEKLEPRLKMPNDKILLCSPVYFMLENWMADNKNKCHSA